MAFNKVNRLHVTLLCLERVNYKQIKDTHTYSAQYNMYFHLNAPRSAFVLLALRCVGRQLLWEGVRGSLYNYEDGSGTSSFRASS